MANFGLYHSINSFADSNHDFVMGIKMDIMAKR